MLIKVIKLIYWTLGRDDVIDVLLKNKTEINVQNSNGLTPFHISVVMSKKQHQTSKFQWEKWSLGLIEKISPTICITFIDRLNITRKLIENGAKINSATHSLNTALNLAAETGDARFFIKNYLKWFIFIENCWWFAGLVEMVELLLKNDAFANLTDSYERSPLLNAVLNGWFWEKTF